MLIRRMTPADLPAVAELDQLSFSQPWPPQSFATELDNKNARCWVAEVDGRVVGMVVGWMLVDEMHIATIATHPDYRRQGIGSKLLLHTLLKAMDEGAQSSFLEVRESNAAAQDMYLKFGYEKMGRRKRYYRDNDEDAILMYLKSLSRDRLPRDDRPAMDREQV